MIDSQSRTRLLTRSLSIAGAHVPRPLDCDSLTRALAFRAQNDPNACSHVFVSEADSPCVALSYAELWQRARTLAARLRDAGVEDGARVVLLLEPGVDYLVSVYACLCAGAVAVPALPLADRVRAIVDDSGAHAVLTSRSYLPWRKAFAERVQFIDVAEPNAGPLETAPDLDSCAPERVALLQYTSGSTGAPKGVMVTHGNLRQLLTLTEHVQGYGPQTRLAGWLPPYHDLGLIGGILQPVWSGFPAIMMSPLAFLAKPRAWLQLLHDARATTTGAPNFAFEMCLRRIPTAERVGLDLSSLETIVCAGEPIDAACLQRFANAFASCGLRASALQPAYGLAESTLEATIAERGSGFRARWIDAGALQRGELSVVTAEHPDAVRLVSCGRPVQEVCIVDPVSRRRCAPQRVGEIWIRSACVCAGYFGRPTLSQETFRAALDTGEGSFLRTGDLGVVHAGELFVTGRMKDLIIVRGKNHYPQDIEASVSTAHAALRAGCAVAFAISSGAGEQLAVIAEIKTGTADLESVMDAITSTIKRRHQLVCGSIALLPPRSLPRTTSGKLQRSACRTALLEGRFETLATRTRARRERWSELEHS